MKTLTYRSDKNIVTLTGIIKNLPSYGQYIPRPLIKFDLLSQRKQRKPEDEVVFDENRIILFDHENFYVDFKDGDRIKVVGELQSRNYLRDNNEVDDIIKFSVQNYTLLTNELPTEIQPENKKRIPISWKKLMQYGLIPTVPEDSMYDENGQKHKSKETPYIYQLDENGTVYKSTEHVAYEVVSAVVERLEEPVDPSQGDVNKVEMIGELTRNPYFDMLGNVTKVPFCSFNVRTESAFFEGHIFYNNVICWSQLAEEALQFFHAGSKVRIIGRLQSRVYTKELRKKVVTASGKKKKKKTNVDLITREISASKIFLMEEKKSKK